MLGVRAYQPPPEFDKACPLRVTVPHDENLTPYPLSCEERGDTNSPFPRREGGQGVRYGFQDNWTSYDLKKTVVGRELVGVRMCWALT
jgi:hypothetical protein